MNDTGGPADVARTFLDAVAWAEHTKVWSLLSSQARSAVLEVAARRGMDPLLAARLRESTAGADERDNFLADLLHGIRADLSGVDFDSVRCVCDDAANSGTATVRLLHDVPAPLGGPLPVGFVELAAESDGSWSVVRAHGSA